MRFYGWLATLLPDCALRYTKALKSMGLVVFVALGLVAQIVTANGLLTVLCLVAALAGAVLFGAATLAEIERK